MYSRPLFSLKRIAVAFFAAKTRVSRRERKKRRSRFRRAALKAAFIRKKHEKNSSRIRIFRGTTEYDFQSRRGNGAYPARRAYFICARGGYGGQNTPFYAPFEEKFSLSFFDERHEGSGGDDRRGSGRGENGRRVRRLRRGRHLRLVDHVLRLEGIRN